MSAPDPSPISDLHTLLRSMSPEQIPGDFVFVCLGDKPLPFGLEPLGLFCEPEGKTLICTLGEARRHGLSHSPVFSRLLLRVHSSLEAVGFLAAVSGALASRGIACNALSAYHHDHLFVPAARATEALECLRQLSLGSA